MTEAPYCSTYCEHNATAVCSCQPCTFIRESAGYRHEDRCPFDVWPPAGVVMITYTIHRLPTAGTQYGIREYYIIDGEKVIPGPVLAERITLAEARDLVPDDCGLYFPRQPEDEPSIVETWM